MAPPPLRPSFSKSRSETEIFVSGAMDRINSPDSVAKPRLRHFSTDITVCDVIISSIWEMGGRFFACARI